MLPVNDKAPNSNVSASSAFTCFALIRSVACPVAVSAISPRRNQVHPHRKTLCQKYFGGDGGSRTRVRNAFTSKELQQYYYLSIFLLRLQEL